MQSFPRALKILCQKIAFASAEHDLFILPGGGSFTDKVRVLESQFNLDQTTTHWMAITAMEAFAYLVHSIIPNSLISHELLEAPSNRPKIILPYVHLRETDIFSHSWAVTSDSIALYYAHQLNSDLILIKVVDGITDAHGALIEELDVTELGNTKTTVVDQKFVEIFQQFKVGKCWIINGLVSDRFTTLLRTQQTIGTKVIL